MCGGTAINAVFANRPEGLSPRVRGNLCISRPYISGQRSIPACAGEPPGDRRQIHENQVYPRVCGGTRERDCPPPHPITGGLSPRVRGNPSHNPGIRPSWRSIPACAGEPARGIRLVIRENGLSPRVRGNLTISLTAACHTGSIPACAGEPHLSTRRLRQPMGLSPRVRGNLY